MDSTSQNPQKQDLPLACSMAEEYDHAALIMFGFIFFSKGSIF